MGYSARVYARQWTSLTVIVCGLLCASRVSAHGASTHISVIIQIDDHGVGVLSKTAMSRKHAVNALALSNDARAYNITRKALSGLSIVWDQEEITTWSTEVQPSKNDDRAVHVEATGLSTWSWPKRPKHGVLNISLRPQTPDVEIFVQAIPPWQLTASDVRGVKTVALGMTAPTRIKPGQTQRFTFTRGPDVSPDLKRQTPGTNASTNHGPANIKRAATSRP